MNTDSLDTLLQALGCERLGTAAAGAIPAARGVGFFHPSLPLPLQVIGSAAATFAAANPWTAALPLAVVIASDARADDWSQQLAAFGIPAFCSPHSSSLLVDRLRSALNAATAPRQHLHATFVRVLELGVLLQGASGSGKSELALDLVSRGHQLVADDAVDLCTPATSCLLGECPEALRGYIEVRGLGIIDVRAAYGESSIADCARVDLSIRIDTLATPEGAMDRVHGRRQMLDLLGVAVPELLLPARLGHNAVMVEAACRDHWLRLRGYVASEAFVAAHERRMAGGSPV